MGCLSNVDIEKELGKNIYIYPLNLDNIKASTINLTASKFAWSIGNNKLSAVSKDGNEIIIPPNDTVIMETAEVIYVTNKICGDYHSKVRLVSKGIGHIGTTLDPLYIGPSLVALHNHSLEEVKIEVGESIVSLMLYHLESESSKNHNNSSGHLEILNGCEGFEVIDKYLDQGWCKTPQQLKNKMIESVEYMSIVKTREDERLSKINKEKKSVKHIMRYATAYSIFIVLVGLLMYGVSLIERKISGETSQLPVTKFILYVGTSGILVPIIIKAFNFIKNIVDRSADNAGIKN